MLCLKTTTNSKTTPSIMSCPKNLRVLDLDMLCLKPLKQHNARFRYVVPKTLDKLRSSRLEVPVRHLKRCGAYIYVFFGNLVRIGRSQAWPTPENSLPNENQFGKDLGF